MDVMILNVTVQTIRKAIIEKLERHLLHEKTIKTTLFKCWFVLVCVVLLVAFCSLRGEGCCKVLGVIIDEE